MPLPRLLKKLSRKNLNKSQSATSPAEHRKRSTSESTNKPCNLCGPQTLPSQPRTRVSLGITYLILHQTHFGIRKCANTLLSAADLNDSFILFSCAAEDPNHIKDSVSKSHWGLVIRCWFFQLQ
ncbi:hypothetical protein DFH08DRAFT_816707 [Mycena albidolilacea]|uniref:Uncharacterized protein n=1 Tax=Mycena albidolilacea TaxID=1033008 RepID=A0AAD7EHX8_9AGAR|nr:hypothetical protein DFH08DRAFT_816707 [Mycena albidolilacea]